MGEAAAWPSFNRTIAAWMAIKERGFATSVPLAGGGVGAAITPPFIAWLMLTYGWRWAFLISAVLGVAGSAIWYFRSRDTPEQHPGVNQAELEIIHAGWPAPLKTSARRVPWRSLLAEKNMWLLFFSAMTCGYMVYIYMTWFFTYLVEQRHLTQMASSYYTIGPFIAMAILTPIGGIASDLIARKVTLRWGRRLISMGGMTAAGISLMIGARVESITVAILWLSFGAGAIYFALASHWATTIDISQKYAGTISGVMNWGGNVGGILSPILTPFLARKFGWVAALDVAAVTILAGAMIWFAINPRRNEALS
jgi:ACS family glucarate transporter-like MFS transporter